MVRSGQHSSSEDLMVFGGRGRVEDIRQSTHADDIAFYTCEWGKSLILNTVCHLRVAYVIVSSEMLENYI